MLEELKKGKNATPTKVRKAISELTDLNFIDNRNRTPFYIAVDSGCSIDILIALKSAGSDIGKPNGLGNTPLMCALAREDSKVAQFLLDSEANVLAVTTYGKFSALSIAARKRSKRFVRRILVSMGTQLEALRNHSNSECQSGLADTALSKLSLCTQLGIAKDMLEVSLRLCKKQAGKSNPGSKLSEIMSLIESSLQSVTSELQAYHG